MTTWQVRLAVLCAELLAIEADPPETGDSDAERLSKTSCKLTALIGFADVPETRYLLDELFSLNLALIDIDEGRKVMWLKPRHRPKGERVSLAVANLRARYGAVMSYLMTRGDHTKEKAARFVAKEGNAERLMKKGSEPAPDWEVVADWYEKYSGSKAFERELQRMKALGCSDAEEAALARLRALDQCAPRKNLIRPPL